MTIPLLLASIVLTTILLALPGVAPYVRAFVSVAKYPAYAYYAWQYTPSLLRRLLSSDALALPIARLTLACRRARQLLTLRSLLCAGFGLSLWVVRTVVTHSGLSTPVLAGLDILTGCWEKIIGLGSLVQLSAWNHLNSFVVLHLKVCDRMAKIWACVLGQIDRFLVTPCLQFASTFWPCALSHGMSCILMSEFEIQMSSSIRSIMSSYPISFFVGLLMLIVLWRCVFKLLVLGALGVHMIAHAYVVTILRLGRCLFSLGLVHWIFIGLVLEHKLALGDFSLRKLTGLWKCTIVAFILHEDILFQRLRDVQPILRSALRRSALRLVRFIVAYILIAPLRISFRLITAGTYLLLHRLVQWLLEYIFAPAVGLIVFKAVSWTCMVCAVGCGVAAAITIELFAALLVPVYYMDCLIHRWYKPSEEALLAVEHGDPSSTLSEEVLPAPSSPSSHSTASEGARRLGLFINAYLDESTSAGSIVELEDEFENTRSMHAPPPIQTTPPSTPPLFLPATPVPGSPVLSPMSPVDNALPGDPSPKVTFELADEGEEMAALAVRLSNFHIESEAGEVPRRSRCGSQRWMFALEA
ncbi:hypothetical protein RhiJN_15188 [Ceratobasidium sp. AG-Ba]|nr:hypothetical protein RhiJN_15188 [Ceratobasidium sp. AG-Ba]